MKRKDIITFLFFISIVCILSYVAFRLFDKVSQTTLTILAGAIGFVVSKLYESIKENKQRAYDKKREVYYNLIKPFREVLANINTSKKNDLTDKQIKDAIEAAFDNILYASDEVIKIYGTFRNLSSNSNISTESILGSFALLLKAMRKDLGNQFSSLDEVDILKMFINMNVEEEKKYRILFKTKNN